MSCRGKDSRAHLDVLGRDWLLDEGAEDLGALFFVQMAEEEVALYGVLKTFQLLLRLGMHRWDPVVIGVGDGLERFRRNGGTTVEVVLCWEFTSGRGAAQGRHGGIKGSLTTKRTTRATRLKRKARSRGRRDGISFVLFDDLLHDSRRICPPALSGSKRIRVCPERACEARTRHVC